MRNRNRNKNVNVMRKRNKNVNVIKTQRLTKTIKEKRNEIINKNILPRIDFKYTFTL